MITRGLPGLRFVSAAAPNDRVLPRMDVVGFVGLTRAGPPDVPVVIENTGQYAEIFGDDLVVSPGAGGRRRAMLGAAVRAFFSNGGRRCVVVRANGGSTTRWPLTGVATAPFYGSAVPELEARAPGAWADGVEVATRAELRSIRLRDVVVTGAPYVSLTATVHPDDPIEVGDLLAWQESSGARVFLPVLTVQTVGPLGRIRSVTTGEAARSQAGVPVAIAFSVTTAAPPIVDGTLTTERWSLTLFARSADRRVLRLEGLGFHPSHARYWRRLPSDAALFHAEREADTLDADVRHPRFPFAGAAGGSGAWELPDTLPADELERVWTVGTTSGTTWARDGVDRFEPTDLLDPGLADLGLEAMPRTADDIRWLRPDPRDLRGVHALWNVEEVSTVVVPDVVLPAFAVEGEPATPALTLVAVDRGFQPCGPRSLTVPRWDALPTPAVGDTSVTLSWDGHLDFVRPDPDPNPEDAPIARMWRVQRASRADFADAQDVLFGVERALLVDTALPLEVWFRVRSEAAGRVSAWSDVVQLVVPVGPTLVDVDADPAVAQRAILRFCAARGDLIALLSTTEGDADALSDHAERIRAWSDDVPTTIGTLSGTDRAALTYGALFTPWLLVREEDGELRNVPPDGAVAGTLARRTLSGGAWLACANQAIRDVIQPTIPLPDPVATALLTARVNPIRREAWGTVALGGYTLADDDAEVLHLHVRRLLVLLRRLALRHGHQWVFEPNSPAFQRAVRGLFDEVMRELFRRGAFAGDRPSSAYDIRVQPDPRDTDQGRFVVELRVAPAVPLRFLTVRLVQDDARGLTTEGV